MSGRREWRTAAAAAALWGVAGAFALTLGRVTPTDRVQRADDGGALAVAFADARNLLSDAFLVKADEYFHGGLKVKCTHRHAAGEDCGECAGHDGEGRGKPSFDPFAWVADGIAAPDRHRHLDGGDAAELLPLVWAAAKADPGNDEAWSTAWYVVNYQLCRPDLAKKLVLEAMAIRPDSVELPYLYGDTEWAVGRGNVAEAEKWFRRAVDLALEKSGGRPAELEKEVETRAYLMSVTFLSAIARDRKDVATLEGLRNLAARVGTDNFAYAAATNALAIVAGRGL